MIRRSFIALLLLLLSALAQPQVPNVFEDGTPASAAEVNENFQYALENASGGCSVEQVDNTAEITCADGTTAVVPGYGAVVVYPEGVVGEVPDISYNTGEIVVKDANDIVLAKTYNRASCADMPIVITDSQWPTAALVNLDLTQEVVFSSTCVSTVYFLDNDFSGIPFVQVEYYLIDLPESFYIPNPERGSESILFSSKRGSAGITNSSYNQALPCESGQYVATAMPTIPYTPAPEILNAAHPVRLEQLP